MVSRDAQVHHHVLPALRRQLASAWASGGTNWRHWRTTNSATPAGAGPGHIAATRESGGRYVNAPDSVRAAARSSRYPALRLAVTDAGKFWRPHASLSIVPGRAVMWWVASRGGGDSS